MSKTEITILGTTAGIPTRKRAHPALYLSYRGKNEFCYLFDCGEGTQRQILLADLNPMKLDEIFITHWHGDHWLGLPGLMDTMGFENRLKPLTIYAPEAERITSLLDLGYSSKGFKITPKDVPAKGCQIKKLLETGDFKIVSVPVKHGVAAVAYSLIEKDRVKINKETAKKVGLPAQGLIYREIKEKGEVIFEGKKIKFEDISLVEKGKKIVYSGDTEICDNLIRLVQDADLLIQDCTYFDSEKKEKYGHASLEDVVKMVEKVGVKRAILTHISRRYRDLEKLRRKVRDYPTLTVAEDFMKVMI
jgi:ribonuclease Z